MRIASDAWRFFIPLVIGAGILLVLGFGKTSILLSLLALFILFFFRDPERKIPEEPNLVVSPADGRVVKIDHDWFDDTTGEKRIRLSIFLTIFNVHINRYPVSGKVVRKEIIPGKFLAAFNHMASEENSRSVVVIDSDYGKITVKQIVGLIARRIICNTEEGETAVRGERYGLIRFGSRMDVIMPPGTELLAQRGDKVYGGSSAIARLIS